MIKLTINDRPVTVAAGTSVAAAIINSGGNAFRHSVGGGERGPICGMGVCFECRVTIDGEPHRRSCIVPAQEGMKVIAG